MLYTLYFSPRPKNEPFLHSIPLTRKLSSLYLRPPFFNQKNIPTTLNLPSSKKKKKDVCRFFQVVTDDRLSVLKMLRMCEKSPFCMSHTAVKHHTHHPLTETTQLPINLIVLSSHQIYFRFIDPGLHGCKLPLDISKI